MPPRRRAAIDRLLRGAHRPTDATAEKKVIEVRPWFWAEILVILRALPCYD
jgi:hypothetical protein